MKQSKVKEKKHFCLGVPHPWIHPHRFHRKLSFLSLQDECAARRPLHDGPLDQLRAQRPAADRRDEDAGRALDQPRGGAAVPTRRLEGAGGVQSDATGKCLEEISSLAKD